MVAHITKNESKNPFRWLNLLSQHSQLIDLAKSNKGFRGVKVKWTASGIYFQTLWKTEDHLQHFMTKDEVKQIFKSRSKAIDVYTYQISAINFIPWQEVVAMMSRHSSKYPALG